MDTVWSFKCTQGYSRDASCIRYILFSLSINSAVKRLKEERCGVECGDEIVPGLLFADDVW